MNNGWGTFFCQEKVFADSSSGKKANRLNTDDEIKDESILGSAPGVTLNDSPTASDQRVISDDARSAERDESAGATGPGSDRKGDEMPGEKGITSLTDGIADFIDKAEDKNSK